MWRLSSPGWWRREGGTNFAFARTRRNDKMTLPAAEAELSQWECAAYLFYFLMPTQTTSIFIVLFANGNVDCDGDCDVSVGSRIFDIGLVCSDSVPAKTSQWLATLADTHAYTHTHTQADTTYNCACLLCVCVDFFPCVVTLTTRRMRNVWQIQCEPTLPRLLLPHTLDSYHLCTNVANSAYKCNKVAGLPFYLSAPRSFSLVLFGGKGREGGTKPCLLASSA